MALYTGKDFMQFEVESSLELVSDQFTATAAGGAMYREMDADDRVTLKVGLLNDLGQPTLDTLIENATIDDYSLNFSPNDMTTTVRGRDGAAKLKDCYFRKLYKRFEILNQNPQPPKPFTVVFGSQKPTIPEVYGVFTASKICTEVLASIGMTLSWGAPFDYEILKDFSAVGPCIDIIRQLTEPFRLVEPLQCDLLVRGSVLYVQQRKIATTGVRVFDVDQGKGLITSLRMHKREMPALGWVTLLGASDLSGFNRNVTAHLLPDPVEQPPETTTSYNPDGSIASVVTTIRTIYKPGDWLLKVVKESTTYVYEPPEKAGTYVMVETSEIEYDPFQYTAAGPVAAPLVQSQKVVRRGTDPNDDPPTERIQEDTHIKNTYDDNDFLRTCSTVKRAFDVQRNLLANSEMTIQTVLDSGALAQEQITEVHGPDESGRGWIWQSVHRQQAAGLRIGGPGRLGSGGGGGASGRGGPPIRVEKQFSTDKCAMDITYQNDNLKREHLEILMRQFTEVQGKIEHQYDFDGVGVAWLKGSTIHIINLKDENDDPIPLQPALVVESTLSYDETTPEPIVHVTGKAMFWA